MFDLILTICIVLGFLVSLHEWYKKRRKENYYLLIYTALLLLIDIWRYIDLYFLQLNSTITSIGMWARNILGVFVIYKMFKVLKKL